jgi:hypothetical protein
MQRLIRFFRNPHDVALIVFAPCIHNSSDLSFGLTLVAPLIHRHRTLSNAYITTSSNSFARFSGILIHPF